MRQVVGRVDEHGRVACAVGHAGHEGQDPGDRRRGARPREHQLAGRDDQGRDAHDGHHRFWRDFPRLRVDLVAVDHATDQRLGDDGHDGPDPDPDEGKPRQSDGPAPNLPEDDRVRGEAEVENAVDDANVEVPEDAAERQPVSIRVTNGDKDLNITIRVVHTRSALAPSWQTAC